MFGSYIVNLEEKIALRGNFKKSWFTRLVAAKYTLAPEKESRAIPLYRILANKIVRQNQFLSSKYTIKPTEEDPYKSFKELKTSVDTQRAAGVSRPELRVYNAPPGGGKGHPGLSNKENVLLRGVHDAIAHLAGGHNFSARGEFGAYNRHLKTLPPKIAPILFTEIVGQISCYFIYGKYVEQKAVILDDFDFFNVGRLAPASPLRKYFVEQNKDLVWNPDASGDDFRREFPALSQELNRQTISESADQLLEAPKAPNPQLEFPDMPARQRPAKKHPGKEDFLPYATGPFQAVRRVAKKMPNELVSVIDFTKKTKKETQNFCNYNPAINKFAMSSPANLATTLIFVLASQGTEWANMVALFPMLMDFIRANNGLMDKTGRYPENMPWAALVVRGSKSMDNIWKSKREIYNRIASAKNDLEVFEKMLTLRNFGLAKAGFAAQLIVGKFGCLDSVNSSVFGVPYQLMTVSAGQPSVMSKENKTWFTPQGDMTDEGNKKLELYVQFLNSIKLAKNDSSSQQLWDWWVKIVSEKITHAQNPVGRIRVIGGGESPADVLTYKGTDRPAQGKLGFHSDPRITVPKNPYARNVNMANLQRRFQKLSPEQRADLVGKQHRELITGESQNIQATADALLEAEYVVDETPRVLYRSMSPQEYADFQKTGKISGGLNKFNAFDPRREVFFADKISDLLIHQGEEIERSVQFELLKKFNTEFQMVEQRNHLEREIKELVGIENTKRKVEGSPEICFNGENLAFKGGGVGTPRSGISTRLLQLVRDFKFIDERITNAEEQYRGEIGELSRERLQARKASGQDVPTSYIIQTKPIAGGRFYKNRFSHEEELSEIGFDSNVVTKDMISAVHKVKNGKIVSVSNLGESVSRDAIIAKANSEYEAEGPKNKPVVFHQPSEEGQTEFWNIDFNGEERMVFKDGNRYVVYKGDNLLSREDSLEDALAYAKSDVEYTESTEQQMINFFARGELINAIDLPEGFEVDAVRDTKWGSIYYTLKQKIGEDEDGEPEYKEYKVSIRDHEPSPFREREFGFCNYWVEVPKNPSLEQLSAAVGKVEAWARRKVGVKESVEHGALSKLPLYKGKAWRSASGYSHSKGVTAGDVVRFERDELGNDWPNELAPGVIDALDGFSGREIVWVGRTKSVAKRYGDEIEGEYIFPNARVIYEDDDGTLVLNVNIGTGESQNIQAVNVNESGKTLVKKLIGESSYIGSCKEIGSGKGEICDIFSDATQLDQALENGDFVEIPSDEFFEHVKSEDIPKKALEGKAVYYIEDATFYKIQKDTKPADLFCLYRDDQDVHYFFWK